MKFQKSTIVNDCTFTHIAMQLHSNTLSEMRENTLRLIAKGNKTPRIIGVYKILCAVLEHRKNNNFIEPEQTEESEE